MVLTASAANNYTVIATTTQNDSDLQREVDLTERAIRNAATRQQYHVLYNALVIGNPFGDPQDETALTTVQIDYKNTFIDAGYLVDLDATTGLWRVSWEDQESEDVVSIYSIRTTLTPGAIYEATIELVDEFFESQIPVNKSRTVLYEDTNATDYEYTVVVTQQDITLDHSASVLSTLTTSSLGYDSSNVTVQKLV